jgi:ethanolamine ammonia-lyase small subunit
MKPRAGDSAATTIASTIDRGRVEELVRNTLRELGRQPAATEVHGAVLLKPDRGVNLGAAFDADAMRSMLASTPARIGVGRAGTRYRTNTLLRFRADHAAAKDAVVSEVDPKLIEKLGLVELTTKAPDKPTFLARPDAGRALSEEGKRKLEGCVKSPQLQVVYGDGLSAAALDAHLEAFHNALSRALGQKGIRTGTPVFVRRSRVKVMDEIARLVDAEACVFTCGERPGLGFADSMSAYYIYRPAGGATDADREVISNINPRGLEPVRAAEAVADACARILAAKKSGVVL